ncbi:hypothetical protein [Pseudalkalibacillus caeni]|uniref:Uncharacterized protein n=1 Tax=Exobacillus caeni TaxID=2574798 RepID=A0A5R9EX27_9BACL|nr:hypothetical protein [Pseudalkalibacillus caeni]TLS35617.1 hypothetical protein FCL54_19135 [Pseudalkalibacillus caeni]
MLVDIVRIGIGFISLYIVLLSISYSTFQLYDLILNPIKYGVCALLFILGFTSFSRTLNALILFLYSLIKKKALAPLSYIAEFVLSVVFFIILFRADLYMALISLVFVIAYSMMSFELRDLSNSEHYRRQKM